MTTRSDRPLRTRPFVLNVLIPVIGIISIAIGILVGSSLLNLAERLHPSAYDEADLNQENLPTE